ncbi:glycoside hydrolase family 45 protein [Hortaea werneckii]|nr:glycoside hydrolase family 45 protein [Hortaea werneckii]KAI7254548.1 glycoside hydrolase family 45 protein [Hortaea werneckii]KAI7385490.1 glycoside hydrolase family 45 protein [Hortaea werneckii]KAI7433092.1 glycoside hydrolase family 45 protein [Hortaea werneckii]
MSSFRSIAFLALTAGLATVSKAQVSGSGSTTRYWDCCKGSCAWEGKADVSAPITTCDADDNPLSEANAKSGCDGGSAYMCSDQSPWAVSSDLAYGFAAVSIPGGSESSWCCSCYELTFTSTSIAGKKMIVQATNTGADLGEGQFDWPSQAAAGWGAQYGGISTNTCSNFPSALQPGCNFRFGDFFEGADNPSVDYKQVTCPKALTDKTGCIRSGETPTESEADTSDSGSSAPASSSTAAPASSSEAAAYSSTAAVESSPASSSVVAAAESSSAPASSSTAPVDSSNPPAYSAPASSAPAYSAPASSSEAAPVSDSASSSQYMSSPYSFSATYGSASSSAAAPAETESAAPSDYASGDEECEVQYVYEYV